MEPSQAQKAQDKVGDGNNNNKGERRRKISQEEPLPCPRCESTNTKFCYYNNYSLTQPRHFCKACKRYWTRGGSLRNIPIGGGCRKNKTKSKEHHHAQPHIRQPHIIVQEGGGGAKAFPSSLLLPSSRMLGIAGAACDNDTMVSSSTAASAMPSRGSSILASSCHALASLPALDSTLFSMGLMSSPPTASTSISSSSLEPLTNLNADLQWRIHHQRLQSILAANAIDDANKENSSSTTSSAYSISKSPCFPTSPYFPGLFQDRSSSSMFSESLQTIPTTPQDGSSSISSVPNVFHLWNHPLLWSAADYHHQHNNHNASMY